jgi:hypothetical protein
MRQRHPSTAADPPRAAPAAMAMEHCHLVRVTTGLLQRRWVARDDLSGRIIAQSATFIGQHSDRVERFLLIKRLHDQGWMYLRDGRRPAFGRPVPMPLNPPAEASVDPVIEPALINEAHAQASAG